MEAIPLGQAQREQLLEMTKYLFPEYPHISLGGEYGSMSRTPPAYLDIHWNRIHWLELLMREGLRRIYSLGRHDKEWLFKVVNRVTLSLMAPDSTHPVTLFYDEYLKILPSNKSDKQSETG
jgi:hypothetical protein